MQILKNSMLMILVLSMVGMSYWLNIQIKSQYYQNKEQNKFSQLTSISFKKTSQSLPEFTLQHINGDISNHDLKNQWYLLFFGYTYCPDICPLALMTLSDTYQLIQTAELADQVQVIFISVDPKRDTLDHLQKHIGFFHEDFKGITGSPETIAKISQALGIYYKQQENIFDSNNYIIDHSAHILIVNPQGKYIADFYPPHEAETMANDLIYLIKHY